MTALRINEILSHPDRVSYWPTEYATCLSVLADLARPLPFRHHFGVSEVPFDDAENQRALLEFLAVFAPDMGVGFAITRHRTGTNWLGRPRFSYAVHTSLPVTGQVRLIGPMKDFLTAATCGVSYLTTMAHSWMEFQRAARLRTLCDAHGIRADNDAVQIAAALAGYVCRAAAQQIKWDLTDITVLGAERCACLMMALFAAANHFSRLSGAGFEVVTTVAPIRLFPLAQSLRIGAEVPTFTLTYNTLMARPSAAQMVERMGGIIADWANDPLPLHIERLGVALHLLYVSGAVNRV
jgi:hypothetical protein